MSSTIHNAHPFLPKAPSRLVRWLAAALMTGWLLAPAPTMAQSGGEHDAGLLAFNPPQPAPGLELPVLDGGKITLTQYRGRYVLLNFWATWCPPCVRELPALQALSDTLEGEGLHVITVALDAGGAADVRPYVQRMQLRLPVALDSRGRAGASYGARDLPLTFLINPAGKVVAAAKGAREWDSPAMVAGLKERLQAK